MVPSIAGDNNVAVLARLRGVATLFRFRSLEAQAAVLEIRMRQLRVKSSGNFSSKVDKGKK
jgi:hypothetical protein